MTQLRFQGQTQNGVIFVDPTDARDRLTVTRTRKNKRAGSSQIANVSSSIAQIRVHEVQIGCKTDQCATENTSMRVDFSGSLQNAAKLKKDWADLKANVDIAIEQGILD